MRECGSERLDVLYDGGCGRCARLVALLRRLDVRQRLNYRDLTRDWEAIARAHPGLREEACLREMHVVDAAGRITSGFDACRRLAWAVPAAWALLPLLYVPGVAPIGRRVYRRIAARRPRVCANRE